MVYDLWKNDLNRIRSLTIDAFDWNLCILWRNGILDYYVFYLWTIL